MYLFQIALWASFRADIGAIFWAKNILLNFHPDLSEAGSFFMGPDLGKKSDPQEKRIYNILNQSKNALGFFGF